MKPLGIILMLGAVLVIGGCSFDISEKIEEYLVIITFFVSIASIAIVLCCCFVVLDRWDKFQDRQKEKKLIKLIRQCFQFFLKIFNPFR